MTTAERYQSVSAQRFDQAHVELDAGDLIQASEKFWGSAAQALKACAQERGWEHNSHAHFFRIVRDLIDETGDKHIATLFHAANSLHVNFYEHWMTEDEIRPLADQIGELIERLDALNTA